MPNKQRVIPRVVRNERHYTMSPRQIERRVENTVRHSPKSSRRSTVDYGPLSTDDFARIVIGVNNRVPNITLYTTERQIEKLRGFCFQKLTGSVVGCDRTCNLCLICVTVTA